VRSKLPRLYALSSVVLTIASAAEGAPLPNRFADLQLRGSLPETSEAWAPQGGLLPVSPAGQANRTPQSAQASVPPDRGMGTNTWAIFGFTEGSDTAAAGERMPFSESALRLSGRWGNSVALSGNLGLAYATSDHVVIWAAFSSSYAHAFDRFGSAHAFGASLGFKYQLLRRDSDGIGLSFQAEPFWQRAVELGSGGREVLGSDFRLILDTALIPDDLFAAANFAYAPEISATDAGYGNGESNVGLSLAVSKRVLDWLFVGAETAYQSKYSGLFFSQYLGSAWFTGPTFYVALGNNGYFGTAWLIQFHGTAAGERAHYDRNQMRFKFGYSF
jgi:hypothetical protein